MTEDLQQQYLERHRGRFGFAGPRSEQVRHALGILSDSKPNPDDLFVIEGVWGHERVARLGHVEVRSFFFCPELIESPEARRLTDAFIGRSQAAFLVSQRVLTRLSQRDRPDGLLSVCRLPRWRLDDVRLGPTALVTILDGIENPGNVGTIVRSVDGVDGDALIVCHKRARLTHPKVIKGSRGAVLVRPVIEVDDDELDALGDWLRHNRFTLYLTDTRATQTYLEADYRGRVAVVAGSERYGITPGWYDLPHQTVAVPMLGGFADSLNVGVSTTVVLYEAGLRLKGMSRRAVARG